MKLLVLSLFIFIYFAGLAHSQTYTWEDGNGLHASDDINDLPQHLKPPKPAPIVKSTIAEAIVKTEPVSVSSQPKKEKDIPKKELINKRKQTARHYEYMLLDKGLDTNVTTSGSDATILNVKYIFMSRVLAHRLYTDDYYDVDMLIGAGFKQLHLYNERGFDMVYKLSAK